MREGVEAQSSRLPEVQGAICQEIERLALCRVSKESSEAALAVSRKILQIVRHLEQHAPFEGEPGFLAGQRSSSRQASAMTDAPPFAKVSRCRSLHSTGM